LLSGFDLEIIPPAGEEGQMKKVQMKKVQMKKIR
jgi:hypothetical protein